MKTENKTIETRVNEFKEMKKTGLISKTEFLEEMNSMLKESGFKSLDMLIYGSENRDVIAEAKLKENMTKKELETFNKDKELEAAEALSFLDSDSETIDILAEDDEDLNEAVLEGIEEAASRFKAVESIEYLENVEQNEEDFKPNFESLMETGQITNNTFLLYDFNRDKFVHLNEETSEREVMSTTAASHKLFEVFLESGIKLKNPASDLKFVKKVKVEFDITKPKFWRSGLGNHFNEFQEEKTKLGEIDKIRKAFKGKLNTDINELKEDSPALYALFMNLFEENEGAANHFLNWFSSFLHTREKNLTAFMFASLEGSGKGVLTDIVMRYFFSGDYQTSQMASMLKRDFNSSLENKLLVNFNEVSSDFSKTDTATQTLKSLITDDRFSLNVKNQREFDVKNNFLVVLSQNNLNGVKMSQSDRRFNYFTPQRTLKDIAENDFNMTIREFIEKIKSELDNLVEFVAKFDYDKYTANELFETESKKRSQLATSSPSEIVFNQIKNKELADLTHDLEEIAEQFEDSDNKMKYSDIYATTCRDIKEFVINIEMDFEKDFITNDNLTKVYTLLVEDTKNMSDRLLKKIFDTNFGASVPKYSNGKTKRSRVLEQFKSKKQRDQEEKDNF